VWPRVSSPLNVERFHSLAEKPTKVGSFVFARPWDTNLRPSDSKGDEGADSGGFHRTKADTRQRVATLILRCQGRAAFTPCLFVAAPRRRRSPPICGYRLTATVLNSARANKDPILLRP
jgi:hypothetical protein